MRFEIESEGARIRALWAPEIEREGFNEAAKNLAQYLALRKKDRRDLQQSLVELGLSSLGRCESRVQANVEAVTAALSRIVGDSTTEPFPTAEAFLEGVHALDQNTEELFGPMIDGRRVRVMVTMPTDAAENPGLIRDLLAGGMDCARINCAHDDESVWIKIVDNVRAEATALGRDCKIVADLGGPKARTGLVKHPSLESRIRAGSMISLVEVGTDLEEIRGFVAECQLTEAIAQLKVGAAVWLDDGKVGTKVVNRSGNSLTLEVTQAPSKGYRLKQDKGLNFPGSSLSLQPLTPRDLKSLDFVVKHVDLVGYSFVQSSDDVNHLLEELSVRGDSRIGIICKIETQRAVEKLPEIIVAAAGKRPLGIMIARGDLAVEIGWERISEMQEEILWICEAAHVPVIWATQVLETLVKKGSPSRAEVTDAAMSERAECVMLNKGPYIRDGLKLLVQVLTRMQEHQLKKMPRLRALRCWQY